MSRKKVLLISIVMSIVVYSLAMFLSIVTSVFLDDPMISIITTFLGCIIILISYRRLMKKFIAKRVLYKYYYIGHIIASYACILAYSFIAQSEYIINLYNVIFFPGLELFIDLLIFIASPVISVITQIIIDMLFEKNY